MTIKQSHFLTAWNNRRLVAGALKAAQVRVDNPNYEDYLQDGVYLYACLLAQYPQLARSELDKLAYHRIIWRTLDSQRRVKFLADRSDSYQEEQVTQEQFNSDLILTIKAEVNKMNELEQKIFYEHVLGQKPLKVLAHELGRHYSGLSKKKSQLLAKLRRALQSWIKIG